MDVAIGVAAIGVVSNIHVHVPFLYYRQGLISLTLLLSVFIYYVFQVDALGVVAAVGAKERIWS